MLIQRQKDIIQLLKQYDFLSSQRLADILHVSSKTIRNDIVHINSLYQSNYIISIKGSGYALVKDLPESNEDMTQQNIQFSILKQLLDTPQVGFYDLADSLYISETSLQKNIQSLNSIIQKRNKDVYIKREKNYLYINGNEKEKRQITTYFLMNELNQYNINLSQYQSFVQGVDIQQIQEYVIQFNKQYKLQLRDMEIISLVIHVSLMLERILQGNSIVNEQVFLQKDYNNVTNDFCAGLTKMYDIHFNKIEKNYVSTLFAGKIPLIESHEIKEMKIFIHYLINEIRDVYDVDLSLDEKLKNNLLIHLLGLKNRIKNHTFLNNPLMSEIKKNYPIVYDMSVFMAIKIQDQFHVQLYEDEIGYITFHLMGSIERLHASSNKKIIILNPFGYTGIEYIQRKIKHIHDLNIEICDVLSIFDYDKIEQYQPDLILSFFHIQESLEYPVYVCHHMLTDTDVEDIYHILNKSTSIQSSRIFFEKDLFFLCDFHTKEEVIHFLCNQLLKKGYIDENYEKLVLERETIAPTAYGNYFAIPHAVKKEAKANKVVVALLDKPILWNEENVRLVFLFCLSKEKNQEFEELFERLVKLLDEKGKVKELLKATSYDQFIECFFKE